MSPTRLQIARKDILDIFENLPVRVFRKKEMEQILAANRASWRVTEGTPTNEFIEFLIKSRKLRRVTFTFPGRKEVRYVWKKASDFEVIQSLRPDGYFSHYTAVFLHNLTLQVPKTVYLNSEQTPKRTGDAELTQERIDLAFSRSCRVSKAGTRFKYLRVLVLNGMYTGQKGVIELEGDRGEKLRTTDIERTLIDITVRPIYSGGVHEVLHAYRSAADRVSVNRLTALLSKLGYIYPYHQAIGFYLERAGSYRDAQVTLLERIEMNFDFYLTHQMKETEYSPRWRLYYPKGL